MLHELWELEVSNSKRLWELEVSNSKSDLQGHWKWCHSMGHM